MSELSYEDFAEFVTKCLATAKLNDITKVRVQDGKAAAFMANSYKIVPLPKLYQTTSDEVSMQFDGTFINGIWSHKISFAEYSANLPVSDYNDIFKKKGLNFSDIMMTLSVASSDTGYSGVHIYPKVVGIMSDGQRLSIPILGEIRMDRFVWITVEVQALRNTVPTFRLPLHRPKEVKNALKNWTAYR